MIGMRSFMYLLTYAAMIVAVFFLLRAAFIRRQAKKNKAESWKDNALEAEDTKRGFREREKIK